MTGRFRSFFSSEQLVGEFEDESRGYGADHGVQGANADCQSEDYPAADGDGDAGGKPIREEDIAAQYCLCTQYTISSSNKKENLAAAICGFGDRRRIRVDDGAALCRL